MARPCVLVGRAERGRNEHVSDAQPDCIGARAPEDALRGRIQLDDKTGRVRHDDAVERRVEDRAPPPALDLLLGTAALGVEG